MRVIAGPVVVETEVRRSRFVARLDRVADEDAAAAVIATAHREHPGARHHCTALRLGPHAERQRSTDDGEPGGTAGVPMLEVLIGHELTDVVAVVSRHFGGILLGAGGLVRAYSGAVSAALESVGTLARVPFATVLVTADHDEAGRLENALRGAGHRVDDVAYGRRVSWTVHVRPDDVDDFRSWVASSTAGRADVALGEPVEIDVADDSGTQ